MQNGITFALLGDPDIHVDSQNLERSSADDSFINSTKRQYEVAKMAFQILLPRSMSGYTMRGVISPDVKGDYGGVTVYKPEKCYNGYTIFCRDWGSVFYMIDMRGEVVHTWKPANSTVHFGELLPNGHLLYSTADRTMEERRGMHELDWDGNEVWYYRCSVDHDARRLVNGNTLIHCREEVIEPEIYGYYADYGACYSPYFIEVTPEKEIVWEWHAPEHIKELEKLTGISFPRSRKDWAHNNNAQSLPDTTLGREDSRFKAGNLLFSFTALGPGIIGIIDRETGEIVWTWGPKELNGHRRSGQHNPTMLSNGHILIFDNGSRRGYSMILELDPATSEIVWDYTASPRENFLSPGISNQQRLPNGNTLIDEGGPPGQRRPARLFEVTEEREIVWEYVNPFYGLTDGYTTIYRHSGRYPPDYVEQFLQRGSD